MASLSSAEPLSAAHCSVERSSSASTTTAVSPFGESRYQEPRANASEHDRHTFFDSAIFTTPSHSPLSSPRLGAAAPLSCIHSLSPTPTDSSKPAPSNSPSITAVNRHSPSPASDRVVVTPWELRQPTALETAPSHSPSIAIAEPKAIPFASFSLSLSRCTSRSKHNDHTLRQRTMSPAALAVTPPTGLHPSPANTFLAAAFSRASSMSKSHHSWRGAGAARPPPASAFTTRPPGMATQMPVLARRNARIGYTKWSPRWIVIDHVDGVLHVYKDPHSLVPTDSIQVSSSHTTIQHAIDRNTGFQMLKVYYLSSRYRFRTDPNLLHAWSDSVPDLALRPGTSPSNLHLLLEALNRSATAPDRAPVWIPSNSESPMSLGHEHVPCSLPTSCANSSASSHSSLSTRASDVFDTRSIESGSWSVPSTLARNSSTRKTPPPLILRPMSASSLMRRPASAPLLSPASAAAAAAAGNPSAPLCHKLPLPSPWHRETASAGFALSTSLSSAYESAPHSVSSTRSSTGSKYMDELLFLDPYFQSQKHHPPPVAPSIESSAFSSQAGTILPSNPFAD